MEWDYTSAKNEYIASDSLSVRQIAEKYKVSRSAVGQRCKKEGWTELRRRRQDKSVAKTISRASTAGAKKAVKIEDVANVLLDKILIATMSLRDGDTKGLNEVASAFKRVTEIKGYKSADDRREQEARINKMLKEIDGMDKTEDGDQIVVEISGDAKGYGV